jgi:predicted GNAT family acetyltransferase
MPDPGPAQPRDHAAVGAVVVTDDPEARRYVATLDGRLAGYLRYARTGPGDDGGAGRVLALGTSVDEVFEGRGVGSALVRTLLDEARAAGVEVVAHCPFVREYAARHPQYADLVSLPRRRDDRVV